MNDRSKFNQSLFLVFLGFAWNATSGQAPIDGLISHWEFDGNLECSENSTSPENHGVTFSANRFDEAGSAAYFDGDSWVEYSSGPWMNWDGSESWSISLWFKADVIHNGGLIDKWDNSAGTAYPFTIRVKSDVGLLTAMHDGSGFYGTTFGTQAYSANTWHHVISTYDSDTRIGTLWMDGVEISSNSVPTGSYSNSLPVQFGRIGTGGHFIGSIDDAFIYYRVITSEEKLQLNVLDSPELGCTDDNACNYSDAAELEDGTCTYPGCTDFEACNFDETAACSDSSCVYPPIIELPDTLHFCDSIALDLGSGINHINWSTGDTTSTIVLTESGTYSVIATNEEAICLNHFGYTQVYNSDSTIFWLSPQPASWIDSQELINLTSAHLATFSTLQESNELCSALDGLDVFFGLYQNFNSPSYSEPSGGWEWITGEDLTFSNWDANQPNNSHPGQENIGHLRSNCYWNDISDTYAGFHFLVETPISSCACETFHTFVAIKGENGCTDPEACNFDAAATCDNGSCLYAQQYYTCDADCITDTDGDGVCDELEIPGCMDMDACNFSQEATDANGSCIYATVIFDCNGECQNDADGNGVCDEYESMCGTSYELGFSEGYQEGLIAAQVGQCGPGTIWNSQFQLCMPAEDCVADLSGDGYVGTVDLLLVLSAYGEDCP